MKITCYSFQFSQVHKVGLHSQNFLKACRYSIHYIFITNYVFNYQCSWVRKWRQTVLILKWQGTVKYWRELLMFWVNYCLCYRRNIFFDLLWCDAMCFCRWIPTFWRNRVKKWPWWWRQQVIGYIDTCLLDCVESLPRTL